MTFHYKPWECERSIIIGDSVICLPPVPSESNVYMYDWQNRAEEIIVNSYTTEYRYVINTEWIQLTLEEMR
ncbi:MAG: hypothetical protein MJZ15_03680 [Bacteroidales bacterium]|nr:hypothetical protein [Bacteroidales bacterium]